MLASVGMESKASAAASVGGDPSCQVFSEAKHDPMRVWMEMKRNGFVTPSFGQIPTPKDQQQHQNQVRKRKRSNGAVAAAAKVDNHVKRLDRFVPCVGKEISDDGLKTPVDGVVAPLSKEVEKSEVRDEVFYSTTNPPFHVAPSVTGHVKKRRICDQFKQGIETVEMSAEGMPSCKGRTKMEEPKVNWENRFMDIAAPSGLLDGLNPGIINRVRNSQQVFSVIKSLVK